MRPSPWHASQRPPLTLNEKRPGTVAALARRLDLREELADRREETGVGRGIRARRPADRALVDADHLVEELDALHVVVRRGLGRAAVEMARDRVVERVVDERRLARARHAGDADEDADRQAQRDALQVVAARAFDRQRALRVDAMPARRHRDLPPPGEVLAGQRMRGEADLLGRPLRDDLSAVLARARPHVDDVVRRRDRVVVVLDDDHAVAEVAQVLERGEQPVVVALVEADRRLVQHVHHARQPGADLRGEPDPLRLAAGERLGRAVEREIVEADVVEEREPAHDLLDDPVGDRLLLAVEDHPLEVRGGGAQRHRGDLEDRERVGAPRRP